ncbi:ribosomal protein S5 domain 2-type protein [Melampsora americana]|nr:ribosomal protein S5 domain 2-type protein [Melampsora americana]
MVREVEASIPERDFLLDALREGLRLDGRGTFEQRPISLLISEDGDSVECSLGRTRVSAHVSATITRPRPDRPFEGLFQVSAEINPLASFVYETGRSSEDEVYLSRLLDKTLVRGGVIDREALCILAGQKVWSIRVDLHFLNDEGNMLDCASVAAIAALQNFRRPDITLVGEEITVHSFDERLPIPLTLHHLPICLTFAFFELPASYILLDPSRLEQQLSTGTMTLTLNAQREICVINKSGGMPSDVEEIMRVIRIGSRRVQEVDALIKEQISKKHPTLGLAAVQDR